MSNYIQFSDFSLFRYNFAYVDTPDYLADDIFISHRLRGVKFGKEASHPDHGYRVIFCSVYKWKKSQFIKCMDELKTKMLMCGHSDYVDFCQELNDMIIRFRNNNK